MEEFYSKLSLKNKINHRGGHKMSASLFIFAADKQDV